MSENNKYLTLISPLEVSLEVKGPVDPQALEQAESILSKLRPLNSPNVDSTQLLEIVKRLSDILEDNEGSSYLISTEECKKAFNNLSNEDRTTFVNIHDQVKVFTEAQRKSVTDVEIDIPGGKAGDTISPCQATGCYAPSGWYPLPSSIIMTAVNVCSTGCDIVVLTLPHPTPVTLAAAHVSGTDYVLCVGGTQAITPMAYGIPTLDLGEEVPRCDMIIGPGNKWVMAMKSLVNGYCGINMLAGPSEVLVVADKMADADVVAVDLIAQAKHDVIACAILHLDRTLDHMSALTSFVGCPPLVFWG